MKILVIMKRFGANKDMVMQTFGRQVKLFECLSKKGHKIDFLCPDYKKRENKRIKKSGITYYIKPYSLLNHFNFTKTLENMIRKNKYDIVVGTTDPLIGILGYFISKKFHTRYVYDMQDEYTHYDAYKIPFVKYLDRIAIKNSDIVLTVSDSLNKHIKKFRKKPTYTIQNGVDLKNFKRVGKEKAKKILKLPKGKIITYIGEISKLKGVDILIDAFKEVKKSNPNTYLLLSGKILDNINTKQDSIIYESYPKRSDVIMALNAADIAVLPNRNNIFSKYCFPYKLAEYMAADIHIVSTRCGDSSIILSKFKNSLCNPNDKDDMAKILKSALKDSKRVNYKNILKNLTWGSLSKKIDRIIKND